MFGVILTKSGRSPKLNVSFILQMLWKMHSLIQLRYRYFACISQDQLLHMVFSHFAIPPIKNTGYFKGVQSDDGENITKLPEQFQ